MKRPANRRDKRIRSLNVCCTVPPRLHDRADDQIEAGCAEGLVFERSVTDFASLMEEHGALEFVRSLALVEASLTAPSQCRARVPFDHEQRSLDAAQFAQSPRELAFLRRR